MFEARFTRPTIVHVDAFHRMVLGGGGDGSFPYVSFDRSLSQYIAIGMKTFRLSTNRGFTAVVYISFTGLILVLHSKMHS